MVKKPKKVNDISKENSSKRLGDMKGKYEEYCKDVSQLHVYIANGNQKTGAAVPSVSLIPVFNCTNCSSCKAKCYDLRNDCCYPGCRDKRAVNAAILKMDRKRYFEEIDQAVKCFRFFRWHIGGDIVDLDYFENMVRIATLNLHCEFLVFTKSFDIVNEWLDKGTLLPSNLHVIFSNWVGQKENNPHNLPTSNPLFADGSTTAHDGAVWCSGNCTECARGNSGCWTMKNGDEVVFPLH